MVAILLSVTSTKASADMPLLIAANASLKPSILSPFTRAHGLHRPPMNLCELQHTEINDMEYPGAEAIR